MAITRLENSPVLHSERPKFTVLTRDLTHEASRPSIAPSSPEFYDCSREGTESLPQLAKLVIAEMFKQESERIIPSRHHLDQKACNANAREQAKDRFLEFVQENEAMSTLSLEFLADLTKRSPLVVSKLFEERAKTA